MLWQLGIVLAFLLVRHSCAKLNASTEDPPQSPPAYDLVDVAQQNGDSNSAGTVQTGQTTRIFTTGEVDDAFWLAHLGEDFKHAIHLQVGGNENYNGIYNMSEDGSLYKEHHEYVTSNVNPVERNSNNNYSKEREYATQDFIKYGTTTEAGGNEIRKRDSPKEKLELEIEANDASNKNYTNNSAAEKTEQQQYESILFDNHHKISTNGKRKNRNRAAKVQQINLKYTPTKHTTKNTKNIKYSKGKTTKLYTSPVVVHLPETKKTIHHLDEMPVVVKMPPVIYHRNTIFEDIGESEVQIHTHAHTQSHNTHTQTNTNTHPEQTQSNANTDTKYTEYAMPHNQQIQQQQHKQTQPQQQHQTLTQYSPYTTHNYFNPSTYEAGSDGGSSSSSSYDTQNIYQHSNQNSDDSTQGLRYIVSTKPAASLSSSSQSSSASSSSSSSNYDSSNNTPLKSSFSDYNHIGRSSRELFNQGL